MKSIEIDRSKPLRDQPGTGHNRFHPDIPPILEAEAGEEVVLETRDGVDGQLGPGATEAAMASMEAGAIHPLTGPVFVKGAQPGDVLEVEFLDILPQPHAFSAIVPGLGFLRDVCTTPFLVQWRISDGWATSPQLPGVRIPGAPFMGVSAVAPSLAELRAWTKREQDLLDRGGLVFPPAAAGAVPVRGPAATEGLRTLPPRENGGNFDVKQLTKGAKLLLRATSPRATARCASLPSRWGPPWRFASACSRGPPPAVCAHRASRIPATSRPPSGPRRSASWPPWACPSATTV